MNSTLRLVFSSILAAIWLAGCAAPSATAPSPTPLASPRALTPFHTPLPSATFTPLPPGTPTPLPSPTPTPRTHTVARGEDLGGISYRYRVSLEALLAANPKVNPNAMSIGTILVIPASAATATDAAPLPTPDLAIQLDPVSCARTRENGAWCFVIARNNAETDFESVSAVIRMADQNGANVVSLTAQPLLNLLPASDSLPLAAYFPPPVPRPFQTSAELLTALPHSTSDNRYLAAHIENQTVEIAPDGLSARVKGEVVFDQKDATAKTVWVMAVAASGETVAGLRRWESSGEAPASRTLKFDLVIYSTGAKITDVSTRVEARP